MIIPDKIAAPLGVGLILLTGWLYFIPPPYEIDQVWATMSALAAGAVMVFAKDDSAPS